MLRCWLSIAATLLVVSSLTLNKKLVFIENRLRYDRAWGLPECRRSDWMQQYANLHASRLESYTPRTLVAVPFLSGLADRIVGFTTSLFVAVLTDRAFQMSKRGIMSTFDSIFYSPYINWQRPADPEWTLEPLRESATNRQYNQSIQNKLHYYAVNLINDKRRYNNLLRKGCPFLEQRETETVFVVNNRGRTIRMFEHPDYAQRLWEMKLTPFTAFGCLANFMIQPKPEIFLPVWEQFTAVTDPDPTVLKISIHIRAGDHVLFPESQGQIHYHNAHAALHVYRSFFDCAAEIEKWVTADHPAKYRKIIWYLASDSHAIRRAAKEVYGDKIVTSLQSKIEHTSKENFDCSNFTAANQGGAVGPAGELSMRAPLPTDTTTAHSDQMYGTPRPHGPGANDLNTNCAVSDDGFATAAAEWWLIGYANYHVITESSGYGRSGAYRTMNRDNIFTIYKDEATVCDRHGFTQLEDLMYDWSGI